MDRIALVSLVVLAAGCRGSGFVLSDVDAGSDPGDAGRPGVGIASFVGCGIEEGSSWWAEASVVIDPVTVRDVRAVLCDVEGTPPDEAGGLPCLVTSEVFFSETRARVRCGEGDPESGGYRYGTVRIVVD